MATITKRQWTTRRGEQREAWVVRYADQGGKWHLKTFDKKADADNWLTDAKTQVKAGTHTADSASVTVAEAAGLWLGRCEADNLESATLIQYRSHVTYHIKPLIGAEKVSRLTMPRIEQFAADLLAGKDRKRSRVLVKKVVGSLKAILKEAQRRGMVAQNVARDVTVKMNGRHNHKLKVGVDIPTAPEVKALAGVDDPKARALVFLAAFAGLRASELRGLAWSHLDLNKPTVTIEERADERNRIGAPKSGAARRKIGLNATTVTALKEWKLAQRPIVTKDGEGKEIKRPRKLVFGTASDRPDGLANLRRRVYYPAMIKAGIAVPVLDAKGQPVTDKDGQPVMEPKYTGLHCLRHFAVSSWLKTCGGDLKAVQTRAGHATLAMTLDTYGHLLDGNDGDQIAAAEKLVLG